MRAEHTQPANGKRKSDWLRDMHDFGSQIDESRSWCFLLWFWINYKATCTKIKANDVDNNNNNNRRASRSSWIKSCFADFYWSSVFRLLCSLCVCAVNVTSSCTLAAHTHTHPMSYHEWNSKKGIALLARFPSMIYALSFCTTTACITTASKWKYTQEKRNVNTNAQIEFDLKLCSTWVSFTIRNCCSLWALLLFVCHSSAIPL